jgi:hypothetical protein
MRIEKEKNLFKFYMEGKAKPYVLDVNTLTFYGLRGDPINSVPATIRNYGYNHRDNYPLYAWYYAKDWHKDIASTKACVLLADRLANALPNVELYRVLEMSCLYQHYDFINKHFAECVRAIQQEGAEFYFNEWRCDILNAILRKELNLPEDTSSEILRMCREHTELMRKPYALWYVTHGLWDFLNGDRYAVVRRLNMFYECCAELDIQPTKSDFFKQYIAVKKNYEMRKKEIEAAKLVANQYAHKTALQFENDEFVTIIPTSAKEFEREGNLQHNCVYTNYLSAVIDGRTNIVFIRRKSAIDTPYITCEVKHGRIWQYLTAYNRGVDDESANAFRELYWKHISENWGD